ncbi:hypothetical protein KI387_027352, partial [Taxus chinensis]
MPWEDGFPHSEEQFVVDGDSTIPNALMVHGEMACQATHSEVLARRTVEHEQFAHCVVKDLSQQRGINEQIDEELVLTPTTVETWKLDEHYMVLQGCDRGYFDCRIIESLYKLQQATQAWNRFFNPPLRVSDFSTLEMGLTLSAIDDSSLVNESRNKEPVNHLPYLLFMGPDFCFAVLLHSTTATQSWTADFKVQLMAHEIVSSLLAVRIEHTGCQLFHGIPSGAGSGFRVVRYHSLVLDMSSLPRDLIPIAWTSRSDALNPVPDVHGSKVLKNANTSDLKVKQHKLVDEIAMSPIDSVSFGAFKNPDAVRDTKVLMGVMHHSYPHYGVQFHPESIATSYGRKIFKNFREITISYWHNLSTRPEKRVLIPFRLRRHFEKLEPEAFLDLTKRVGRGLDASDKPNQIADLSDRNEEVAGTALRLCWKKLKGIAAKVGGSENIFCSLFGNCLAEDTFWLDSSTKDHGRARFSFMGGKGGLLWRRIVFKLSDQSDEAGKGGGSLLVEDESGSVKQKFLKSGLFDFLSKELQSFTCRKEDYEGLPFDFCGGYVGYIGYELKTECGVKYNRHESQDPDACFFLADRLIAIDHWTDDVYILSVFPSAEPNDGLNEKNFQEDSGRTHINGSLDKFHEFKYDAVESVQKRGDISSRSYSESNDSAKSKVVDSLAWMETAETKLLQLMRTAAKEVVERRKLSSLSPIAKDVNDQEVFRLQKSKQEYMEDVNRCLQYIKDGESYELCLTTQIRKRVYVADALCLYLNLREKNPAPYAAWLHFGKEDLCICSSSPERFLRLDRNGILEAKPIKGTIPRGNSQIEDEKLRSQLQNSEKDQAENLMIVDLLRNDLGRVCEPGTVHVPSLMDLESYATVHTLVSTIRGKKRDEIGPIECVRAAFPGGSMTGAPKLRAMEILDSIENTSRGVYSGAIGFFSFNQTFDLNIVIRTVVLNRKEASIGAGGAIVALSDPEDEYDEMLLKARAPMNAVTEVKNQLKIYS